MTSKRNDIVAAILFSLAGVLLIIASISAFSREEIFQGGFFATLGLLGIGGAAAIGLRRG